VIGYGRVCIVGKGLTRGETKIIKEGLGEVKAKAGYVAQLMDKKIVGL